MNPIPSKETRDKWREQAKGAMHSGVDEYNPKTEFNALLDAVDALELKYAQLVATHKKLKLDFNLPDWNDEP